MTSHQQTLESAIPDLRDVPVEELVELRDSVFANSVKLYKQRLLENGVALNSFGSSI